MASWCMLFSVCSGVVSFGAGSGVDSLSNMYQGFVVSSSMVARVTGMLVIVLYLGGWGSGVCVGRGGGVLWLLLMLVGIVMSA